MTDKKSTIDEEMDADAQDYFPEYFPYNLDKDPMKESKLSPIPNSWDSPRINDKFEPLTTPEDDKAIKEFLKTHPSLKQGAPRPIDILRDDAWIQTFSGRKFCPTNPNVNAIVIEDIAHALSMQCRFSGHTKKFYCVTPDTKILTSDLIWKPAGELKLFEGLVGFDENTGEDGLLSNNRKSRRKMKYSYVLHTGLIKRHVYALHLSDGTILKSSDEHPWLICSKKSKNQKWESTKEIIDAIKSGKQRFLLQFLKPWEDVSNSNVHDEQYMLGYISGIFDGEATINCNRKGFLISIAQNPGPVLDKIKECLSYYGITYSEYSTKKCHNLQLTGTWSDKLKFLSIFKPIRLIDKYKQHLKNNEWRKEFNSIKMLSVVKIEDLGIQDVVALETSSKTYFSEGFGSHNSVAQHSVCVSYLCDHNDALWGLMHDASEAYLVDVPSPLKRSGHFDNYIKMETVMMAAIIKRFKLAEIEPPSVKKADTIMLATEARDLMSPLHTEWVQPVDPLPFMLEPLGPQDAKNLFMKRFLELSGYPDSAYKHYLNYESK